MPYYVISNLLSFVTELRYEKCCIRQRLSLTETLTNENSSPTKIGLRTAQMTTYLEFYT